MDCGSIADAMEATAKAERKAGSFYPDGSEAAWSCNRSATLLETYAAQVRALEPGSHADGRGMRLTDHTRLWEPQSDFEREMDRREGEFFEQAKIEYPKGDCNDWAAWARRRVFEWLRTMECRSIALADLKRIDGPVVERGEAARLAQALDDAWVGESWDGVDAVQTELYRIANAPAPEQESVSLKYEDADFVRRVLQRVSELALPRGLEDARRSGLIAGELERQLRATEQESVGDDSDLIDEDPLPSAHADDGFWQWRSYPDGTYDAKAPGAIAWTERLRNRRDVWAVLHGWPDLARTTKEKFNDDGSNKMGQ